MEAEDAGWPEEGAVEGVMLGKDAELELDEEDMEGMALGADVDGALF